MLSNVKLAELVDYSIVTQRDTYTPRNCKEREQYNFCLHLSTDRGYLIPNHVLSVASMRIVAL